MQKRITIHSAHVINNKLMLVSNEAITGLLPGGQMLVDSNCFSFIYLMEKSDEYTYIVMPESIWAVLKKAIGKSIPTILTFNDEQIELVNFQEELKYLISNIEGNGNYGEQMVEKVETLFKF